MFCLHYPHIQPIFISLFVVFTAAGILVTSGQYIGDPIDCIVDGVPGGLMDTYCWIHSTFSIPSRLVLYQVSNKGFFVISLLRPDLVTL